MAKRVKMHRYTAAEWSTNNWVLNLGEFGIESDTYKMKIGNGVTAWNSLYYFNQDGATGATGETGE